MSDDVERIDLVDDFHGNTPARMKPIRVQGVGHVHGYSNIPTKLRRQLFSANVFKPTEKDRRVQAEINRRIDSDKEAAIPRSIRVRQVCEYHYRLELGREVDWYFCHNKSARRAG